MTVTAPELLLRLVQRLETLTQKRNGPPTVGKVTFVSVGPVAPATGFDSSGAVPAYHWYEIGPSPAAFAPMSAVPPATIVVLCGCEAMVRGHSTVTVMVGLSAGLHGFETRIQYDLVSVSGSVIRMALALPYSAEPRMEAITASSDVANSGSSPAASDAVGVRRRKRWK